MAYALSVVLKLPLSNPAALPEFVEVCIRDKVRLIAVWGPGCNAVEDEIDWLITGDKYDESRFIATTSHPDETLEETIEFAEDSTRMHGGSAQLVSL